MIGILILCGGAGLLFGTLLARQSKEKGDIMTLKMKSEVDEAYIEDLRKAIHILTETRENDQKEIKRLKDVIKSQLKHNQDDTTTD